jgi:hypothetical protein
VSLKSEQIPNKALNGAEVIEIACKQLREMIERDCMFSRQIAYRRVAFTIQATFHLGQPHQPYTVRSRVKPDGVVEGEAPLAPEPEEGALVSLERDVTLDNPNLARVHHDLPVRIQERMPPRALTVDSVLPGEPTQVLTDPFPEVKNTELHYDKTQYPEHPKPVDRDVSQAKAEELGLKFLKAKEGMKTK